MIMAIKVIDIDKIDKIEIGRNFGAKQIDHMMVYNGKLAEQLNENIFEFNGNHEIAFHAYLKECQVTGRSFSI